MKRCTKCGKAKPLAESSRDRSRKDRRHPECKACVMEWRQASAERLNDYNRRWRRANRDSTHAQDKGRALDGLRYQLRAASPGSSRRCGVALTQLRVWAGRLSAEVVDRR
jgi:hypothetical protein